jgi:predicted phage terminase large subunit-like protein
LVGANFYLIDVYRARLSYPNLKRAVVNMYKKHHPDEILIEDQSSGIALIEELKREDIYTVTAWKPKGGEDKYQRLAAESIKFEEGRILLPKNAEWADEYIRELIAFPGAKHDDQVDSTTQALAYLTPKANAFAPFRETNAWPIYPVRYPIEY